ncbi:hypothetical protein CYMTET_44107, partial [Cymbomonas tetramitiformis]
MVRLAYFTLQPPYVSVRSPVYGECGGASGRGGDEEEIKTGAAAPRRRWRVVLEARRRRDLLLPVARECGGEAGRRGGVKEEIKTGEAAGPGGVACRLEGAPASAVAPPVAADGIAGAESGVVRKQRPGTGGERNAAERQAAAEAMKEEIKTGGGGAPASSGV